MILKKAHWFSAFCRDSIANLFSFDAATFTRRQVAETSLQNTMPFTPSPPPNQPSAHLWSAKSQRTSNRAHALGAAASGASPIVTWQQCALNLFGRRTRNLLKKDTLTKATCSYWWEMLFSNPMVYVSYHSGKSSKIQKQNAVMYDSFLFVLRFNHKLYIQVVVSNHRWSQMRHSPLTKIVRQHILHTCWLAKFSSCLGFLHLGGWGPRCHARSQQGTLRHITHRPSIAKRASLLRFLQGWSPKAWNVVALVGQTSMLFKMHQGHTFSYIRDTTTNIIVLSSGDASETYQEICI